jgi:hypothetical protein
VSAEEPQGANRAFVRAMVPAVIFAAVLDIAGGFLLVSTENWMIALPCLVLSPLPLLFVVLRRARMLRRMRESEPAPTPADPPQQPPIVQ